MYRVCCNLDKTIHEMISSLIRLRFPFAEKKNVMFRIDYIVSAFLSPPRQETCAHQKHGKTLQESLHGYVCANLW